MRSVFAGGACSRSIVAGEGCPNVFVAPTEITAKRGWIFLRRSLDDPRARAVVCHEEDLCPAEASPVGRELRRRRLLDVAREERPPAVHLEDDDERGVLDARAGAALDAILGQCLAEPFESWPGSLVAALVAP